MRAFFFPGQMSEHPDMWPNLVRRVDGADEWLRRARAVTGLPLAIDAPGESGGTAFDDLTAQLAVLTVNAAWADHLARNGAAPAAVAGHSLGCYSALVAAGVIGFEDALGIAMRVQRLAREELDGFDGAMGVLIGHGPEKVAGACRDVGRDRAMVANVNTAKQVVISGHAAAVDEVLAALAPASMRAERLHTGVPFHSRWMKPVVERLLDEVEPSMFAAPGIAVYSHLDGHLVSSADEARELVCTQIARRLDWLKALKSIRDAGFRRFVECGPGEVLSRMTRWVLRDVEVRTVETDCTGILGDVGALENDCYRSAKHDERG